MLTGAGSTAVAQRAAGVALIIRLGNAALAYLAQVVLARLMGQFEYGVFAYTWVWFLVFAATATLGFGDSPLRFIAQLRERDEIAHVRGFLRLSLLVVIVTSAAAAAIIALVMPFTSAFIGSAYVLPMVLMGLSLPFACVQSFLEGVGRSYGWTIPALLPVYILRHALLLALMAGAVWLGFEASAVNAFTCLIIVVTISLLYQGTDILLRLRRVLPGGPVAYRAREWIGGSAPFAILYGASNLSSFADVIVLSFFVRPEAIAIYFAATRIIQVVNLVPYAATVGTAHLFAAAHTRGDQHELQRLCRHVAMTTLSIAAAAVVVILAGGDLLLNLFGAGFDAGYASLAILAAGVLARVSAGPAEDLLNMTGNGRVSASTYVVVVALNVVLAIALIIPFGIEGAAVASAVSLSARALWLSLAVWRRLGIQTSILTAIPLRRLLRPTVRIDPSVLRQPAE